MRKTQTPSGWLLAASLTASAWMLSACAGVTTTAAPSSEPAVESTAQPSISTQPSTPHIIRQDVATALYEVAYSASERAVFVASAGGLTPEAKDSPASRILRLAPDTLAVQTEIALPARGFGLALDDAAGRLYVTHGLDATLSVIDVRSNRVIGTLQLAGKLANIDTSDPFAQKYPHSFRTMTLDAKNNRLYIPGLWMKDSALYVVDTRRLELEAVIPGLGFLATGSTLSPDGKMLYISNLAGQIFTIDTHALKVVDTARIDAEQALYLTADASGKRLFIVDQGFEMLNPMRKEHDAHFTGPHSPGGRIVVIDVDSKQTLATLPTGNQPVSLLLDAPRQRLYVANRGAGTLTVFDSENYQPLQTLELPRHPNSLALDNAGNVLYATIKNEESNSPTAPTQPESVVRIISD